MCSSLLRGLSTFVGWFVSEKAQIEIRSVKTPYFVLTGVACGWGGEDGQVLRPSRTAKSEKIIF